MAKWRLFLHVAQWIFVVISLACLPVPILVAEEQVEHAVPGKFQRDSDEPTMLTVTTVQPAVRAWVLPGMLIVFVSANALAGLGWLFDGGSVVSRIAVQFVSFALPFSWCAGAFSNLAPWQYGEPVLGGDHESYYVMESSFLQGQTLALARLESEDWLRRTSRVLVETNGDSPRTWQSMIRPAGANEVYGLTVSISSAGMVLGFRYDNHCFFAYDVAAKKPYGRNGIRSLSPFILLTADTPLHSPDVSRVEQIVRKYDSEHSGVPRKDQLEEGMRHLNPAVVNLAKSLLAERKQ